MEKVQVHFVLIHGSWHTGDCWNEVIHGLEEKGYSAIAPTMPGHGIDIERKTVRFSDYESALYGVIEEIQTPVIVVAHSSAGVLLQNIAPKFPANVIKLVFLNAFVLPDDMALIDAVPSDIAEQFKKAASQSKDNSLPVDTDFFQNVVLAEESELVKTKIISELVPQPYDFYLHQIDYKSFSRVNIAKVFLYAKDDKSLPNDGYSQMAANLGEYEQVDIPGGHEVMYTNPGALVAGLMNLA